MRIVAGRLKGRRLDGPKGAGVRPTSDALRETLFNILGPAVEDARVLDGYAGTGAIGLEAWSRGAARVAFVERDARALATLRANVARCGAADACVIIRGDFRAAAAPGAWDLVVVDPPYDEPDLAGVVDAGAALVAPGGRLVLEHSRRREPPGRAGRLARRRTVTAGDSALSFYGPEAD